MNPLPFTAAHPARLESRRTCPAPLRRAFALLAGLALDGAAGPDASAVCAVSPQDQEIEAFLEQAAIVASEPLGGGVTGAARVTLQQNGERRYAVFKTVDVVRRGVTWLDDGSPRIDFTDRYHYERAAYLLDRCLDLRMVPVTVLRKKKGQRGALIDWVNGSISEAERLKKRIPATNAERRRRQLALMDLFDALILSTDRNQGNMLFTVDNWKLHLIDHTRSFRLQKVLPRHFRERPACPPRELTERLRALEKTELQSRLDGLIDRSQVRGLLARRNRILAQIESDRERCRDGPASRD